MTTNAYRPKRRHGRTRGFTLVELLITLAILGLLATLAVPGMQMAVQRKKEFALQQGLLEIRQAIDAYKLAADSGLIEQAENASGYPPSLQTLIEGVDDLDTVPRRKRYFLRRLPRDPMFPDPTVPAADTWGKRSYASPHDAPRAGADVYDVYSLSPDTALNGSLYRTW